MLTGCLRLFCQNQLPVTMVQECMFTSLWASGKPLFAGNGYADLSETALHYIGGIIKHAKALNVHQSINKQLQALDPRLRSPSTARLFARTGQPPAASLLWPALMASVEAFP